jgi:hypothetical protein
VTSLINATGQNRKHLYLVLSGNNSWSLGSLHRASENQEWQTIHKPAYGFDLGTGLKINFLPFLNLSMEYRYYYFKVEYDYIQINGTSKNKFTRDLDHSAFGLLLGFDPVNLVKPNSKLSVNFLFGQEINYDHSFSYYRDNYGRKDLFSWVSYGRNFGIDFYHEKLKWLTLSYNYRALGQIWFQRSNLPSTIHTHSAGIKVWLF